MSAGTRRREPLLVRLGRIARSFARGRSTTGRSLGLTDLSPSPCFRSTSINRGAGRAGYVAAEHYAVSNSISIAIVALLSPVLGTIADYSAAKKRMLGLFLGLGASACGAMELIQHATCCWPRRCSCWRRSPPRRARCSTRRCCRTSRGRTRRIASPAGVCDRLSRRRRAARIELGVLALARSGCPPGRISRRVSRRSRCASRWSRWRCGGCCFRSRCSAASRAASASSKPTSRAGGIRWAWRSRDCRKRCASCAVNSRPFSMLVAFLIDDGIATIQRMATAWHRDRSAAERADYGDPAGAVHRRALHAPPRCARRVDRGETRGVGRPRRVPRDQRARLLHAHGDAVYGLAMLVGLVQGGHAGVEPLTVRVDDPDEAKSESYFSGSTASSTSSPAFSDRCCLPVSSPAISPAAGHPFR